jgi:hypothetical protein
VSAARRESGAYAKIQPLLLHIRIMQRFFEEAVVPAPTLNEQYPRLDIAYRHILNEELAPYALELVLAVMELADAAPDIAREFEEP